MGRRVAGLGAVGGEKAVLVDRGQTTRDKRFGSTGFRAQERRAVRKLDGKPGQEVVADNPELPFSRLKQEVIAGEVKIRLFNARKRNRGLSLIDPSGPENAEADSELRVAP